MFIQTEGRHPATVLKQHTTIVKNIQKTNKT